jgi:hypothetical protein
MEQKMPRSDVPIERGANKPFDAGQQGREPLTWDFNKPALRLRSEAQATRMGTIENHAVTRC